MKKGKNKNKIYINVLYNIYIISINISYKFWHNNYIYSISVTQSAVFCVSIGPLT